MRRGGSGLAQADRGCVLIGSAAPRDAGTARLGGQEAQEAGGAGGAGDWGFPEAVEAKALVQAVRWAAGDTAGPLNLARARRARALRVADADVVAALPLGCFAAQGACGGGVRVWREVCAGLA